MSMVGNDGDNTVSNKLNEIAEAIGRIENTLAEIANSSNTEENE